MTKNEQFDRHLTNIMHSTALLVDECLGVDPRYLNYADNLEACDKDPVLVRQLLDSYMLDINVLLSLIHYVQDSLVRFNNFLHRKED